MEIKVGDRVRVNEKGMATDSSDKVWMSINSEAVDQVKHMEYLTVTDLTGAGNIEVSENDWTWPFAMFEVVPEEGKVFLSQEEKDILKGFVQSQVDTYTRLLAKLK